LLVAIIAATVQPMEASTQTLPDCGIMTRPEFMKWMQSASRAELEGLSKKCGGGVDPGNEDDLVVIQGGHKIPGSATQAEACSAAKADALRQAGSKTYVRLADPQRPCSCTKTEYTPPWFCFWTGLFR
jgi:hypothetical protein